MATAPSPGVACRLNHGGLRRRLFPSGGAGWRLVRAFTGVPHEDSIERRWADSDRQAVRQPTARDFAALLPLSLTLTDYARIEHIADLPQKLTQGGAESTVPLKQGDLAYYAPWGNLAIFIEDGTGNYTGDLMRLGAVETGLPALQRPEPLQVRIERMPD